MKLSENFNQQEFIDWISSFLPDFYHDVRKVDVSKSSQGIKSIQTIGESAIGVRVYIIETDQDPSRRKVGLATESFSLLRDYGTPNAIIVYYSVNSSLWRLSLLTSTLTWDEGKIKKKLSNPKRQSYVLGSKSKVKTPHQYLINKGSVADFADLKSRFSLEVVNKEFYKEISSAFIHLVGGQIANGKSKKTVEAQLKLPSVPDQSQIAQEFAVRLIGRIIFCWFLREKKSPSGRSLMPTDLLSLEAAQSTKDYYHTTLEPIFFEVLNKKVNTRNECYAMEPFSEIPYLNGGLFAPHYDDHYDKKKRFIVVVPDTWFVMLFEILETYNFTIDENTSFDEELSIDPEMLGRIFENLLAEINPETGESARKSTGSYYTPRVIVDYMVDESLYLYLKEKTSINEKKLRSVISYDLEDDSTDPLTDSEKNKITQALQSVKILDPACGSGAFPIGALQKIVFILQQIDPHGQLWFNKQIQNTSMELRRLIQKEFEEKNFDYLRKLGIIRENIYGVDIQPIATEISRLRCFLTLVVDQRVDDTLLNRGIEPLPNLDFKFVTANTLLGMPQQKLISGAVQQDLFDSNQSSKIEDLRQVIDDYFNCSDAIEKSELKSEFRRIQNDLWSSMHQMNAFGQQSLALSGWDPFSHKPTEWFDSEWMFGIKEGFDLVIANPPYLGEKKHKEVFHRIKSSTLKNYYQGKMDLFYFFFHQSLNMVRDNGIISFISTNYYPTATGGKKLRKDIQNRAVIHSLINFNELRIFESALGQHNMITTLIKSSEPHISYNLITSRTGVANQEILSNIINGNDGKTKYYRVTQNELYDGAESYIRLQGLASSPIDKILNKLAQLSTPLGSLCNINQGIVTSADKISNKHVTRYQINAKVGDGIFVISESELNNLSVPDSEYIKPWFKNSDIYRYCTNLSNSEYLIYADIRHKDTFDKKLLEHLSKFEQILKDSSSNAPFLHRPRDINFSEPKIVAPQRSNTNTFGYNESPWYASADVYFITSKSNSINLKYLLALLNSRPYYLWLYHRGKRKGESLELYQKPLSEIPIKIIDNKEQSPLIELVDKIIELTQKPGYDSKKPSKEQTEYERQIDSLVYKLYDLSQEEIKLIENEK